MASTPTTRARFQKQGTGDNVNSWGTYVNEGGLDRIDEAINGRLSKTITADATLTATNYAADESRMAIYDLSGSLAGVSKIITIPSVEAKRLVYNHSGADLSFKTSGGSAVTVRNGMHSWIWSDGTNTYVQDPTLDQIKTAAAHVSFGNFKLTNVGAGTASTDGATLSNRLDQFAAPTASVGLNSQKITSLANGTASGDAVNKGQLDAAVFSAGLIPAATQAGQTIVANGSLQPTWGALDLANGDAVTNQLPLTRGGTGAGTRAGASAAILPAYSGNGGRFLALKGDVSDVEWRSIGLSVTAISTNTTVDATHVGALLNCTNTITLSLTAVATLGSGFSCAVRNNGTGVVTIDPNSSEQVDGRTTIKVYPGESFDLICTGSAWLTVGRIRSGWVYLGTSTVGSSVVSVDFTLGVDDTEIRDLEVRVDGLLPAATGHNAAIRLSKSASYLTSYRGEWVTNGVVTGNSNTGVLLSPTTAGDTTNPVNAVVRINGIREQRQVATTHGFDASQNRTYMMVHSTNGTAGPVDAYRILYVTSNTTAGTIVIYGLRG